MTATPTSGPRERLLSPAYAATTIGVFALIAFNAFETLAVTTVMPTISQELDGRDLYALAFAAPLASSVVGMVAAGLWSDRRGPAGALLVSLVLFTLGVLTCGLAPAMEVLVAGRVVQGLGTGALIVSLYVVVGVVYPSVLQPAVFASFAAAWVLPSLFGPGIAAFVAAALGWRWVFLGIVGLVLLAAALIAPVLPSLRRPADEDRAPAARSQLLWAAVAAVAVLGVELLGSRSSVLLAGVALLVVLVSVRPLTPRGTLRAGRGLPAVIGTRGMMSAAFFCGQAYIVLVLQERWGLTAGHAGIALTVVGIVWASASQLQARLRERVSHEAAMQVGTLTLLGASVMLWLVVWGDAPSLLAGAAFVAAGAGMGFGFSRTGVAMLAASTDTDRGFNSSALTIADSLGAALALSLCGIGFTVAEQADGDPFLAVFGVAVACAAGSVVTAFRTPALTPA
ncbi:MFS transporter [Nocardioides euryhalodurans]|uniref:MFS transporter n=1 Tax=Nocardioides euryhalodurans TaxID=2518370 RepID=A0A4P7GKN4_9ACTN|nr:MFS transporter [Nocardioides euryhalodurans]QBR92638.1 MFS transporter [Nocardioides euryhalodurans]